MSDNWQAIAQNGWFPAVSNCYSAEFPMEIRFILNPWLQQWAQDALYLDPNNAGHHHHISAFLLKMINQLFQEIEKYPVTEFSSFFLKNRLKDLATKMQIRFADDMLALFRAFLSSLTSEKQEIARLQSSDTLTTNVINDKAGENRFIALDEIVTKDINQAKFDCAFLETSVRDIRSKSVDIHNLHLKLQQLQAGGLGGNNFYDSPENPQEAMQQTQSEIQRIQTEISDIRQSCWNVFAPVIQLLNSSHQTTLTELEEFELEQPLIGLGKAQERKLDVIDKWFQEVYNCLITLEKSLWDFHSLFPHMSPEYSNWVQVNIREISTKRTSMIRKSLVIDIQPSQIIRKETKFGPIKLRFLVPANHCSVSDPEARIINEDQVRELSKNPDHLPVTCGSIKTAKGYPRVLENEIEFKDIRVSEPARKAKRGEKSVVEEKFCMYFRVAVNIPGFAPKHLWKISLPMAITTHPNQEGEAWGTIFWDNAFSSQGRQGFEVPEEVPWENLIQAYDLKFQALSEFRRGLTDDNKLYLKHKLFQGQIPANDMVSRKLFCKDVFVKLSAKDVADAPDESPAKSKKGLSFQEWLYLCIKVLACVPDEPRFADQRLDKAWGEGKIIGFISEHDMIRLLKDANARNPGTFLLRFSERRVASIGIYYYNHRAQSDADALVKIGPYTTKKLKEKPLQDRILKSQLVAYLYHEGGNIPKEKAFSRSLSRSNVTMDGYLQLDVVEYFPSYILDQFKPELPQPTVNSPWSSGSVHSVLSPGSTSGSDIPESVVSPYQSSGSTFESFLEDEIHMFETLGPDLEMLAC